MQFPTVFINPVDNLISFLSFDLFISPAVFFLIYYLGAIIIPLLIYRYVYRNFKNKVTGKLPELDQAAKLPEMDQAAAFLKGKKAAKWIFLASFISFEIFWRILFEFIMAYFQMRDALMSMAIVG